MIKLNIKHPYLKSLDDRFLRVPPHDPVIVILVPRLIQAQPGHEEGRDVYCRPELCHNDSRMSHDDVTLLQNIIHI